MEDKKVIYGFKAYNKGLIDKNGVKFEIGKNYTINEESFIKQSFHFCEKLEDSLSLVDSFKNDIEIAKVCSSDVIHTYLSSPFCGYSRYVSSSIEILEVLPREEIINMMLEKGDMEKFIALYKLTDEEINFIKDKYDGNIEFISRYIDYYQKDDKHAFTRSRY